MQIKKCKKCYCVKKWRDGTLRFLNYKVRVIKNKIYYFKTGKLLK